MDGLDMMLWKWFFGPAMGHVLTIWWPCMTVGTILSGAGLLARSDIRSHTRFEGGYPDLWQRLKYLGCNLRDIVVVMIVVFVVVIILDHFAGKLIWESFLAALRTDAGRWMTFVGSMIWMTSMTILGVPGLARLGKIIAGKQTVPGIKVQR
jgi:hypothetical protein